MQNMIIQAIFLSTLLCCKSIVHANERGYDRDECEKDYALYQVGLEEFKKISSDVASIQTQVTVARNSLTLCTANSKTNDRCSAEETEYRRLSREEKDILVVTKPKMEDFINTTKKLYKRCYYE